MIPIELFRSYKQHNKELVPNNMHIGGGGGERGAQALQYLHLPLPFLYLFIETIYRDCNIALELEYLVVTHNAHRYNCWCITDS